MIAPRRARPPDSRLAGPAEPARTWPSRLLRLAVNLIGAGSAAFFAVASAQFYLRTHSLIGGGFVIEQAWFVLAFLIRRPARAVTRRWSDWLLAFGGTFGGTGFRPAGLHAAWGVWSGLAFQTAGLIIGLAALVALGRSFGMAAADRGLVTGGPYALVRHPIYLSYLLVQCGYLLQSLSWRNAVVLAFTVACNAGRALAEERLLAAAGSQDRRAAGYQAYRARVRWRIIPGIW
jgi:protein-S-isoprenylcysteine O-methyltransferase Ste14